MRRYGSITLRHLVVAVLVVVVVNAQLTWWIIFVLGQNREWLELERQRLESACRRHAAESSAAIRQAEGALASSLLSGSDPAEALPPDPFVEWRGADGDCGGGWTDGAAGPELRLPRVGGCVVAVPAVEWGASVLGTGADVEWVSRTTEVDAQRAVTWLPAPFSDRGIRPSGEVWDRALETYRGRIVMMVSEGGFFGLMLFVLIALLVRTLRREAELERQHRNFLSAITHELKSPLASVRLALETVLKGRADPTATARFLDNALGDTERLQGLVQKVLEVTRYDRGGGTLEFRTSCLSGVVDDVVATFARRSGAAGVRVDAELVDDIWADVDGEAWSIVVSNLLENAAKYGGEEARVGVRLELRKDLAVLEVSDNGPGIPEDVAPYIFDRFYRSGDEMTRTTGGTGLGLYLVKRIVTAHGGNVEISSTGPDGTTFRVTQPGAKLREARP
jgi:signal transduction histidine kinase